MANELRPRTAVALLVVALVVLSAGSAMIAGFTDDGGPDHSAEMVELDDGSELWPYTSRGTSFDQRTLPINLVMYGDVSATERLLREDLGEWEEVDEEDEDFVPAEEFDSSLNETSIAWGTAAGANRYVYVESGGNERWLSESYQLNDGPYLGTRHHIRAYDDPVGGDWTAIQAHQEHWDWFHLRHTVHSTEGSQSYVEAEFIEKWYVDDLHRARFGNDGWSDANGWVTVVEFDEDVSLILALLLSGAVGVGRWSSRASEWWTDWRNDEGARTAFQGILVAAGIVGLYAAVRFGAIGIESAFPDVDPKFIVAVLYPVLVAGLPVVAYSLSRPLESVHAFTAASIGVVVAIFVDYTYLGVTALPIDAFLHRIVIAVAIGFVAAGASRTARAPDTDPGYVRAGVLLWAIAVTVPFLRFV